MIRALVSRRVGAFARAASARSFFNLGPGGIPNDIDQQTGRRLEEMMDEGVILFETPGT